MRIGEWTWYQGWKGYDTNQELFHTKLFVFYFFGILIVNFLLPNALAMIVSYLTLI